MSKPKMTPMGTPIAMDLCEGLLEFCSLSGTDEGAAVAKPVPMTVEDVDSVAAGAATGGSEVLDVGFD